MTVNRIFQGSPKRLRKWKFPRKPFRCHHRNIHTVGSCLQKFATIELVFCALALIPVHSFWLTWTIIIVFNVKKTTPRTTKVYLPESAGIASTTDHFFFCNTGYYSGPERHWRELESFRVATFCQIFFRTRNLAVTYSPARLRRVKYAERSKEFCLRDMMIGLCCLLWLNALL